MVVQEAGFLVRLDGRTGLRGRSCRDTGLLAHLGRIFQPNTSPVQDLEPSPFRSPRNSSSARAETFSYNSCMSRTEPPSRQRCGARLKREPGNFCARYVAPGKTRCNLHGGKSMGPRKPARLTPERLVSMQEGRRRWVKCLKATGQKAPCGGDFTKSAKEKAARARLHEDRARNANEAMFRANPDLVEAAIERLAEATMRLAEATHHEKLARPADPAAWMKTERERRNAVRLYAKALFACQSIPEDITPPGGRPEESA